MPLVSWALLGLLASLAAAHPGHKAPEGHFHVYAAPAPGSSSQTVEMGACVGERTPAAPPASAAPFDLKKSPVEPDERGYWKLLGFSFDDERGRLLRPDGAPASAGEVEHLRAPFDAASERMDAETWLDAYDLAFRLDERDCRLKDNLGRELTRLEARTLGLLSDKSKERMAVEVLKTALGGLKPTDRVPPAVLAKLDQLKLQQLKLPAGLESSLRSAGSVSQALASVDAAHVAATRFWDGQTRLLDHVRAALPPSQWTIPERGATYLNAAEKRLGEAIERDLIRIFGENEPGRELLARFKKADGTIELPHVMVLKLAQRRDDAGYGNAAGIFSPSSNAIVFNHWGLAEAALRAAPEAERAKLSKDFSDPAKLAAYLTANPSVRGAVLESVDTVLYHELIHAWQHRRARYDVEMLRGNLPGYNPLEKEHEAFREQYRYFHAKLMKDPAKALADPEAASYMFLLASYGDFRDAVTYQYMTSIPGSASLDSVRAIHKDRRLMAERLRFESPQQWLAQSLRLAGFKWGDTALKEMRKDMAARSDEFQSRHWPRMRDEGFPAIVRHHELKGRTGEALLVAVRSRGAIPQGRIMALRMALESDLAARKGTLNERLPGWQALDELGEPVSAELAAVREADFRDASRAHLAAARKQKGAERQSSLESAAELALKLSPAEKEKLLAEIDAERRR